jgi:hypothetical protein
MSLFIPFILLLACFWLVIGVLIAKWLKQAGHAKPFKGKDWQERQLYGAGVGFGGSAGAGVRENRKVGLGQFGEGRVKGL